MCDYSHPHWKRILRKSCAGLGLLLALALTLRPAHSQATQGSVAGTVKDPNGSVVANASVTLTNTDEGAQRTTRTNSVGDYQFLDVKAAQYQVDIEATGFQKFVAVGVALQVRQELRLDAKLTVGAVQQEIKVTGERCQHHPDGNANDQCVFHGGGYQ